MRRTHPRIILPPELFASELISLYGEEYHHLTHVLRVRKGDEVDLGDGRGHTARARVEEISRDHVDLLVSERENRPAVRPFLTLFQGATKGLKLDLIVRQNVELGVDRITPFLSGYSVHKGAAEVKLERLRKIAAEAGKQCRRAYAPEVTAALDWEGLMEEVARYPVSLVAWEEGEALARDVLPAGVPERLAMVIGPEGGFSAEEIDCIQGMGGLRVSLGPNVLRTETAGLVMHAVVRCRYGLL